ncbi:GTP 3',8-cyclase MoaA [Sphingomonas sp. CGMCC 1.13654]|uniref:GTP 3',8-cyclase n=1 Tax=Sphingomonas chungangi TaxID=2683589 RepID=A0A838LCK4_9SPHN|nr:GTP 3',8-cyclase MoaA [Sphingomonas chungangi]MBA2936602.1 GTP 3',8-cyclase MoaA [Sphingomonas chungangi]MVW55987.1 GTP 3',8-cyclase MoaA [Sphingomonas chungangi]
MAIPSPAPSLSDAFGRRISYVRLSVTDRCDLRCRYCMSEAMSFLPRREVLTLEELAEVANAFVTRGVTRIRLTGGEPLARRGIDDLARSIGRQIGQGLEELTLTTNATRLADHAGALFDAGVRRINVSLDSRDPDRFRHITRTGDLDQVLGGIEAARAAGLRVKINMVALKGLNEDEIAPMIRWCGDRGFDLTLIETMPLGVVDEDRTDRYLPLDGVRARLEECFTFVPDTHRTGGPARYARVAETGGRIGFITPLTDNFCEGCNRLRVTIDGKLTMCLGHEDHVDLKKALRGGGRAALDEAIDEALRLKPRRHHFAIAGRGAAPAVSRHMSVTGG